MKGFFGRVLRIDLGRRRFRYEAIGDEVLATTLGGKGLGIHLLAKENPPGADPLSPDNRFILTVGPVTGTKMWSQSRFAAFAKSPATGGFAESYCGGTLAPRLKGCGIDAVVAEGRAEGLTFLVINEDGVRFEDAEAVRGADTVRAEEELLRVSPKGARGMAIGPAGENLVRFACVKSDRWRSLGRCGLGAVLGSKNVKGISFAGGRQAEIADPEALGKVIKDISRKGKESPSTALYRKYGTPLQVAATNAQNCFPTRYWSSGHFAGWEKISGDAMLERFDVSLHPCPNCFLACTKLSRVKAGRHRGLELEGPEYETIYALGGLNEVDSIEEIAWLNDLCDKLGLDTMSAGNIAAFATEARLRGKIDFEIGYNRPERMAELLRMIAERRGVGDLFANGIREASEELGLEGLAAHVKGLEPAGFEPRTLKGMALSYATSARGACHLRGTFYKAELSGLIPQDQIEGKAALHIDFEDRAALFDSLILCRFFRDIILWDEIRAVVAATAGLELSKTELERLANATTEATRAFNRREGMTDAGDTLPPRFFEEPTAEGATISRDELATMVREYNDIRRSRL